MARVLIAGCGYVGSALGDRRVGDLLNLEADVLGKYVKHYLDQINPGR